MENKKTIGSKSVLAASSRTRLLAGVKEKKVGTSVGGGGKSKEKQVAVVDEEEGDKENRRDVVNREERGGGVEEKLEKTRNRLKKYIKQKEEEVNIYEKQRSVIHLKELKGIFEDDKVFIESTKKKHRLIDEDVGDVVGKKLMFNEEMFNKTADAGGSKMWHVDERMCISNKKQVRSAVDVVDAWMRCEDDGGDVKMCLKQHMQQLLGDVGGGSEVKKSREGEVMLLVEAVVEGRSMKLRKEWEVACRSRRLREAYAQGAYRDVLADADVDDVIGKNNMKIMKHENVKHMCVMLHKHITSNALLYDVLHAYVDVDEDMLDLQQLVLTSTSPPPNPDFLFQPLHDTATLSFSLPLLPPITPPLLLTLVLDLDETILHYDTIKKIFLVRPYTRHFLREVSRWFEVVVFTAATKDYTDYILDRIDIEKKVKHRLYRPDTEEVEGCYVKDLNKLGRDLSKTIIVDNNPKCFQLQPLNGIYIRTWKEDAADRALLHLADVLVDIGAKQVADVRVALRSLKDKMLMIFKNEGALPTHVQLSK